MQKKWQKALGCMLAATMLFSVAGCDTPPTQSTGGSVEERPDSERTQL